MNETSEKIPAAYLPFKTFLSAIESLEHGLPRKLDRTIWRSQSGIVQGQIMTALRFFGLLNDSDEPTPALHRLVENKEKRAEQIGSLLLYAYKDIIEHDLTKMTPKMLDEAMGAYNVQGDTRRKAVAFFLRATRYADMPMHPLLERQIRNTVSGTRKKRSKGTKDTSSNNGPASTQEPSHTSGAGKKTIPLRSGGSVTVEISANPFLMSPTDRTFVFELIDSLHKYVGNAFTEDDQEEGEE